MSDWFPENDGAYRAEMAAMYPTANRRRIKELEAKLAKASELETERDALAFRVSELEKDLQDVVVAQYDDGSRIYLSSYAGGAAIRGEWSELTLVREDQDGSTFSRRYEAREAWSKAPSAALQENTDD